MKTHPLIEKLVIIQSLYSAYLAGKRSRDEKIQYLKELVKDLKDLEIGLALASNQIKSLEIAVRSSVRDLQLLEDNVLSLTEKINKNQNPKFHEQLKASLQKAKAARSQKQRDHHHLRAKLKTADYHKWSEEYEQIIATLKPRGIKISKEIADLKISTEKLNKKYKSHLNSLDPRYSRQIRLFKLMLVSNDGIGIVPVVDSHCEHCKMTIDAITLSILRYGQHLPECSNCHVFLYDPTVIKEIAA